MRAQNLIKFAKTISKLKSLKRSGWVREKIKNSESVADHSFRSAVLAMILAPYLKVDELKFIKMMVIHDIGEAEIGDIVWQRGRKISDNTRLDKEKRELAAIKKIFKSIDPQYPKLFHELLARKTREAQLVWEIDKLETAIQAKEYADQQKKNLGEFIENADMNISNTFLKQLLSQLK